MPTAPVVAASLIAGYGVATRTGKRPVGGLVFAAGTAWCAGAWQRRRGAPMAAGLVGFQLGAWPSVLTIGAAGGVAAALLADRR